MTSVTDDGVGFQAARQITADVPAQSQAALYNITQCQRRSLPDILGGAKKRSEHSHVLCSRAVDRFFLQFLHCHAER